MFRTLCEKYPRDKDLPARAWEIARLRQVLDGTIYDCLRFPFSTEESGNEYVPVFERRPSVRYNLCRTVVEDAVSLLFGEGRFPALHCPDEGARRAMAALVTETCLDGVMSDAALRGSVGSVVVRLRVLDNRVFFDVMNTEFLTPTWKAKAPDTLESVTERYKVKGADLAAAGYAIGSDDLDAKFWFQRTWTDDAEEWYVPQRIDQPRTPSRRRKMAEVQDLVPDQAPKVDDSRTIRHQLGFVPLVWIKNLPGGTEPDGWCTFGPAVNSQIEIEYQLSQAGRGLRYSSDPMLMIKEPASDERTVRRSASNVIEVDDKGDAKLLEITGAATDAVITYVKGVRELALETIHGNRSTPDKVATAQSGRALELLHEPLIWLAGKMRTPYGAALLGLVRMVARVANEKTVEIAGEPVKFPAKMDLTLRWGPWFHSTDHDKLEQAQALRLNTQAGHMSRETAVMIIGDTYAVPDPDAEMAKIETDQAAADARTVALAQATQVQVKAAETLPD